MTFDVDVKAVPTPPAAGQAADPVDWRARADRNLLAMLLGVAVIFSFKTFVDPDLPGHLAYGLEHLRSGRLARTDPYSYTVPGAPWINHEWAFELLIAVAYTALGTWGLLLLQGAAWIATGALMLRLIVRQTGDPRAAAVLFVFYLGLTYLAISVRPQLASFLSFAVLLTLLESGRRRPALLMLAVPLMAVWTNMHGGFLAGLGVLGAYAVGAAVDAARGNTDGRHAGFALAAAALAALATLANPYGPEIHRWLLWSLVEPNPNITEWQPMRFNGDALLFGGLALLTLAAFWRSGLRALPFAYVLPLAATAWLSVQHTRHVPFFAMLACASAPVAVLFPPRGAPSLKQKHYRYLLILMVGLLVDLLALRLSYGVTLALKPTTVVAWPTGAVQYVDSLLTAERARGLPPRNAVVSFNWAQLAIWRWYPQLRVHYDGRHRTVYPLEIEHQHWRFLGAEPGEWRSVLEGADMVLVQAGSTADRRMRGEPGWGPAYADDVSTLYLRGWRGPAAQGTPPESLPFETRLWADDNDTSRRTSDTALP